MRKLNCSLKGEKLGLQQSQSSLLVSPPPAPIPFDLEKSLETLEMLYPARHKRVCNLMKRVRPAGGRSSLMKSSVIITIDNLPNDLSVQLERFFSENEDVAEAFQNSVMATLGLEWSNVTYLFVSSASSHVVNVLPAVPQSEANMYLAIIKTSSLGKCQGKAVCKSISHCLNRFKNILWQRPEQRVMLLCLSPRHKIFLPSIYTDPNSQEGKYYDQSWLAETKALLAKSKLLQSSKIDNDVLSMEDSTDFVFFLFTFDSDSYFQDASLKVVKQSLGRIQVRVMEIENFSLLSTHDRMK